MIKKLILSTALVSGVAYGASPQHDDAVTTVATKTAITEKTKYPVWNPPMGKKESGESCEDGNCIKDLNCFQKDGRAYKFFTSLRDKVKKQCKKL